MTSQSASFASPVAKDQPRQRTVFQQQRLWGWVFLSPWIVGFLAFTLFPMAASLFFSFTDFKISEPIHWVGLTQWNKLLTDPVTLQALGVTLRFGIFLLPVSVAVPLGIATLISS